MIIYAEFTAHAILFCFEMKCASCFKTNGNRVRSLTFGRTCFLLSSGKNEFFRPARLDKRLEQNMPVIDLKSILYYSHSIIKILREVANAQLTYRESLRDIEAPYSLVSTLFCRYSAMNANNGWKFSN